MKTITVPLIDLCIPLSNVKIMIDRFIYGPVLVKIE